MGYSDPEYRRNYLRLWRAQHRDHVRKLASKNRRLYELRKAFERHNIAGLLSRSGWKNTKPPGG